MIIEDGRTGMTAAVNNENRLAVDANIRTMISHVSIDEEEAYMTATPMVTVSGVGGNMMYMKNTRSGEKFTLSKVIISWNGGDVTGDTALTCGLIVNASSPSAGHTEANLANFNLGSGNVADFDYYYWDGSTGTGMTLTGGSYGPTFLVSKGLTTTPLDEAMVIPYNYSISFYVTPPETGKFSIITHGFYGGIYETH